MQIVSYAGIVSRGLAALLVMVIVAQLELISMVLRNPPWSMLSLMVIGFLALVVLSIAGLVRLAPWGFYAAYALVPFSTIFHGIALVPFVSRLLPTPEGRIWSVFVLNIAFLATLIIAHRGVLNARTTGRNTQISAA